MSKILDELLYSESHEWVKVDGKVYKGLKFDIPDGGCTIPAPEENGFYILRVVTDGSRRSFKMIINH